MAAHLHEDPERTTPIGLARYGRDFLQCALIAGNKVGQVRGFEIVAPAPVMYLIGHSIELTLKAFLLHNGVTLRELRLKFDHDLESASSRPSSLGLFNRFRSPSRSSALFIY